MATDVRVSYRRRIKEAPVIQQDLPLQLLLITCIYCYQGCLHLLLLLLLLCSVRLSRATDLAVPEGATMMHVLLNSMTETHKQLSQVCVQSEACGVQVGVAPATLPLVSTRLPTQVAGPLSRSSCSDKEDELTHAFKACRLVSRSPWHGTAQGHCLAWGCALTQMGDLKINSDGL